jgi:hypothetical protein
MVFEVYLHFAIYRDNYNFLINTFFNHLIFNLKVGFFLQSYYLSFELFHSKYHLQKTLLILTW